MTPSGILDTGSRCVMIIAGETSGDHHGAMLVSAMKSKRNDIFFCGIGGDEMQKAGVRLIAHCSELSVVGISEVISRLPGIIRSVSTARKTMAGLLPDLLILIDFPDFNFKMAKYAKKLGIPVLYYISPQLWAWRRGRIKLVKSYVDHMAVILPFEAEFYARHGVCATFVGHPLLDRYPSVSDTSGREKPAAVAILPGSRPGEVKTHLPVMMAAATHLARRFPGIRFLVSVAPSLGEDIYDEILAPYAGSIDLVKKIGPVEEIVLSSRVAIAVSGTVTLECAILGIPFVVIYRISAMSYGLGRMLIDVPYISLANIIAGRRVVPELIQNEAVPEKIAAQIAKLYSDEAEWDKVNRGLMEVRKRLGPPGASERTADIAIAMLDRDVEKTSP